MELICYLSNGYPTLEKSAEIADYYIQGGCSIIEIDLPSRDPYLESSYIADRMAKALAECPDYDRYMENIINIKKKHPETKFFILVYESTVKEIGTVRFSSFCNENNFNDIILVGLENERIKNELIDNGLKISCYIQFYMDREEIESAKASNGFVYMQAKSPPEKINPEYPTLADCIKKLRSEGITRNIYCGVGVYTPDDYKMVKDAKADGAFVGSTILKLYDNPAKLMETIAAFKAVNTE